jgi:hypothetical protein
MTKCNDLNGIHGVVFHCDKDLGHDGDHRATRWDLDWPQHPDTGARWVIRRPGAWLWHRIETSKRTACGASIDGLTLTTLRGRTLAKPPAGGLVCPQCLSVAPWVPVDGALASAA